jgi:hypothetical protein
MSGTRVIPRLFMDGPDLIAHHYQDVEDIIEHNKALQTIPQRGDFRHIASIPNNIIVTWLNEEWARGNTALRPFTREFDQLVQRKLADPEWAYLRTDDRSKRYV